MTTFTFKALLANLFSKKYILLISLFTLCNTIAQTSLVQVSVDWPSWSSENRVEIYNPGGTLIMDLMVVLITHTALH